ncbi:uncharacterized protein LOC134177207 [Corticium candelabrum]|uniref:uncharacterized protein LOC134177207 n=1 Tax=Corticium candelabrum TaxID=121492 RepID=UPI002E25A402|nr:uncharacterized protein LOC134177207 [Corticium candelabrum]
MQYVFEVAVLMSSVVAIYSCSNCFDVHPCEYCPSLPTNSTKLARPNRSVELKCCYNYTNRKLYDCEATCRSTSLDCLNCSSRGKHVVVRSSESRRFEMPLRKIRQLSNFNQFFMSSCTTFTLCCVPLGNSSYAYSNWKSEKKLNVDWSNRLKRQVSQKSRHKVASQVQEKNQTSDAAAADNGNSLQLPLLYTVIAVLLCVLIIVALLCCRPRTTCSSYELLPQTDDNAQAKCACFGSWVDGGLRRSSARAAIESSDSFVLRSPPNSNLYEHMCCSLYCKRVGQNLSLYSLIFRQSAFTQEHIAGFGVSNELQFLASQRDFVFDCKASQTIIVKMKGTCGNRNEKIRRRAKINAHELTASGYSQRQFVIPINKLSSTNLDCSVKFFEDGYKDRAVTLLASLPLSRSNEDDSRKVFITDCNNAMISLGSMTITNSHEYHTVETVGASSQDTSDPCSSTSHDTL